MSLLPNQHIIVNWNSKHKSHYLKKGYIFTFIGDSFSVCPLDLPAQSKKIVAAICDICGRDDKKITYRSYNENLQKNGFYKCKVHKQSYYEECFKNKGLKLLSVYTNARANLRAKCPVKEHPVFEITWNAFYSQGAGCQKCSVENRSQARRIPFEKIKSIFKSRGYTLISSEYKNSSDSLEFICPNGHRDDITFNSFYYREGSCKKCNAIINGDRTRLTYGFVLDAFENRGYVLLSETYNNCYQKLDCICPRGHFTKTKWVHFVQNHGCFECSVEDRTGEKSPRWNPHRDRNERIQKRVYFEYRRFVKIVKDKYKNSCICCVDTSNDSTNIEVHHLDGFNWCISKRTDPNNAVTLCEDCHSFFHNHYGYGNNTKNQFLEWFSIHFPDSYNKWIYNYKLS